MSSSPATPDPRPTRKRIKQRRIVAHLKRESAHVKLEKLVVTLADLVTQCLEVIQRLNCVVLLRLESDHGKSAIDSAASLLSTKLRPWVRTDTRLFEGVATELAWILDNYNAVGAEHSSLCLDTMNGFFVGPVAVSVILERLFYLLYRCYPATDPARLPKQHLLDTTIAIRYERHDRLVARTVQASQRMVAARDMLEQLKPGKYKLHELVQQLGTWNLEHSCLEAMVLITAARLGFRIIGEKQLVDAARLLHPPGDKRDDVTLLGPGIVPRRLWDCLLPYVSVDSQGRTLRGTVDQGEWLVTHSYSGVAAGFSRLYGSRVGIGGVAAGIGVVHEAYRPTISSLSPDQVATLEWIVTPANEYVVEAYKRFRDVARLGSDPRGRESAAVWLCLYDHVRAKDQQFADGLFTTSMAVGVISLLAATSDQVAAFCKGLLVRVVATLSPEECSIQSSDGGVLNAKRDDDGNVVLTSPTGKVEGFLKVLAQTIDQHCVSRGTPVWSDLGYEVAQNGAAPDFVGSTAIEAFTPAVWINMQEINTLGQPPGENNAGR